MSRTTIDFGIDLGVQYTTIAVWEGENPVVIKNNDNMDNTPSAVWIDKNNRLSVGRVARQRVETEPEDAYAEFRLQMGTQAEYRFGRSGRMMHPEELTAEVFKSLIADVQQRLSENVPAAVIAVPAAFDAVQRDATRRAAEQAGLKVSPFILEPTAAAMALAYKNRAEEGLWLVYDLNESTFSAALVQLAGGNFQILRHAGDNQLGVQRIDWQVVEHLLAPAVAGEYSLPDFARGNPQWRRAFARLKQAASDARVRLSTDERYLIGIDFLCSGTNGEPVAFEYELTRSEVANLALPLIQSTLAICVNMLKDAGVSPDQISAIIPVGEAVQASYVVESLENARDGLGVRLDFSVDPLSVVAQGAAIFAGTQLLDGQTSTPAITLAAPAPVVTVVEQPETEIYPEPLPTRPVAEELVAPAVEPMPAIVETELLPPIQVSLFAGPQPEKAVETIDYGISLGPDYCVIAHRQTDQIEVIPTAQGGLLMPTAAWLDPGGQLQVGAMAVQHLIDDPGNCASGFIGMPVVGQAFRFERDGRLRSAQELIVAGLKALRSNAFEQTGETVLAAVISVPAGLDSAGREDVRLAARQAGLTRVVLVDELEAAARAQAFLHSAAQATWLVYNLGAWSFHAAVIARDGDRMRTPGQAASGALGDKAITWAVVDRLLTPDLVRRSALEDFRRENPRWCEIYARLGAAADEARNALAAQETYQFSIDFDRAGEANLPSSLTFTLHQADIIRVAEPVLKATVDLTRQALAQAGIPVEAIDCAILAGEATLSPIVDGYLNDRLTGLGMRIDYSIDPLTIAAQGAAASGATPACFEEEFEPAMQGPAAAETDETPVNYVQVLDRLAEARARLSQARQEIQAGGDNMFGLALEKLLADLDEITREVNLDLSSQSNGEQSI